MISARSAHGTLAASFRTWFPFSTPSGHAVSILCFPFAGGTASAYQPWTRRLLPAIEILPVELPAHGLRRGERPRESLADLADLATEQVAALAGPIVLFGHSMGSLLAFEVARRLCAAGRAPRHLIVSAHAAPHVLPEGPPLDELDDGALIAHLRSLEGTPEEVLASPDLLQLILPVLRHDLRICREHRHREAPPLEIPLTALGGIRDPLTRHADLKAWEQHSTRFEGVRQFPGGHFYLQPYETELLRILAQLASREDGVR